MKLNPMVFYWTIEFKYYISIVKLDLSLGYFGVNAFIEARFYFTLGFSSGGVLFWSAPYAWMPICLSEQSVVHMWYYDLELLSVSLAFYAANTPISRGCFLHYWTFVWQIHWSPVDHSDKWYRLSIFSLVLASTMWVSCWIYSRVYGDLRGHGGHVIWNCSSRNILHASFIFGCRWCYHQPKIHCLSLGYDNVCPFRGTFCEVCVIFG